MWPMGVRGGRFLTCFDNDDDNDEKVKLGRLGRVVRVQLVEQVARHTRPSLKRIKTAGGSDLSI